MRALLSYTLSDEMPSGHGSKSVIIIQDFIKLTDLEKLLIMWHINHHYVSEMNKRSLNNAITLIPAIIAMHTADLEASTFLEETIDLIEISKEDANIIQNRDNKKDRNLKWKMSIYVL